MICYGYLLSVLVFILTNCKRKPKITIICIKGATFSNGYLKESRKKIASLLIYTNVKNSQHQRPLLLIPLQFSFQDPGNQTPFTRHAQRKCETRKHGGDVKEWRPTGRRRRIEPRNCRRWQKWCAAGTRRSWYPNELLRGGGCGRAWSWCARAHANLLLPSGLSPQPDLILCTVLASASVRCGAPGPPAKRSTISLFSLSIFTLDAGGILRIFRKF